MMTFAVHRGAQPRSRVTYAEEQYNDEINHPPLVVVVVVLL